MPRNADAYSSEQPPRLRIDKWLWAARFFKTRSLAAQAVEGGKVKLNDERVKSAKSVRVGDRLSLRIGESDWCVTVMALAERRGPAESARTLYEEDELGRRQRIESVARRRTGFEPAAQPGGRPEKRARRALRRVRGY